LDARNSLPAAETLARDVMRKLNELGYNIPGDSDAGSKIAQNEIRFFNKRDAAAAATVQSQSRAPARPRRARTSSARGALGSGPWRPVAAENADRAPHVGVANHADLDRQGRYPRGVLLRPVLVLAAVWCSGCGFQVAGATGDAAPPNDVAIDAPIDVLSASCTPGEHACDGRARVTCGADEQWDFAHAEPCDFTCAAGACVLASNVPADAVAACTGTAPRLAPVAGATVTLSASGGTHLECEPDCGDAGVTRIAAAGSVAGTPGLAYFCLSSIALPSGVTLGRPASGGPEAAIAFVVDGNVEIAGDIDFNGGAGVASTTVGGGAGLGAPGGFNGAGLSDGAGKPGSGPCPGQGGENKGSSSHWIGGGGGGGGGASMGGGGGAGRCTSGDHNAAGRSGGGMCGTEALSPLVGGSGGGSGGDGTVNVQQGWAGGGGGGALQISSRTRIAVTGALRAAGGAGYGNSALDGGGGGGAGGALLLEAPALALTGALVVDGGKGGTGGAGAGGLGATGASGPATGASQTANGQSGSGGGGAGGRIRLNSIGATCPPTASPAASCTAGALASE
jgi:hypothetical protein